MTAAKLLCEAVLLKRMVVVKAVGWTSVLLALFLLAGVLGGVVAGRRNGAPERGFGRPVAGFSMRDAATGRNVAFDSFRGQRATVFVFLGIDCPISNLMLPRLSAMAEAYGARGAKFFGVNSNAQEDAVQVAEHARVHGVRFPMLLDEGQAVAERFQVDRMCEVLVVDDSGYLRYRGALDDQYGRGAQGRPWSPVRC